MWTFLIAIALALASSPVFCADQDADTGGVSQNKQVWAGKKVFLDNSPVTSVLTGAATLYPTSKRVQRMDPGGSSRNVTLPAVDKCQGVDFVIVNTADAAENLVMKNAGASTIVTIGQDQLGFVWCDGGAWYGQALSAAATGYMLASGATVGAVSQAQEFTNGVKADAVTGITATTLALTAFAGTNAVEAKGGAGSGAGAGGAAKLTGGLAGATNAVGGAATIAAGAGQGTGAGAVASMTGGASGGGATGNGGVSKIVGGAAASTDGIGGAAQVTGGAAKGTGTGGAVTVTTGASEGATGTAGSWTIDTGSAAGGTAGTGSIGATNTGAITLGRSGQTVTLPGVVTFTGTQTRTSQTYRYGIGGAKVGGTAGFVINAASNISAATVPQSQTASILIVPIPYIKQGAIITGFGICGQIESAGGAVTVDGDLRVQTAIAADFSDASVGTMTQIAVTADTKIGSSQDKGSLAQTVATDESYYLKITVTTAATTDVDIRGIVITVTEK